MASCVHGHEPSHLCGICIKERNYLQFGGIHAGEVGTPLKGKKVSSINYDAEDAFEKENAEAKEQAMKDFILESFGGFENNEKDGERES